MTFLDQERKKHREESEKIEIPPLGRLVGILEGVPPPTGWPNLLKSDAQETEPSLPRRQGKLYWGVRWWSEKNGAKNLATVCFGCGSSFQGVYEEIEVGEKRKELWPQLDCGLVRVDGKFYRCRCTFAKLRRQNRPEAPNGIMKQVLSDRLAEAMAGSEFMKRCKGKPSSLLERKEKEADEAESTLHQMVGVPKNAAAVAWLEQLGDPTKNQAFREAMKRTHKAVQEGRPEALDGFAIILADLVKDHQKATGTKL